SLIVLSLHGALPISVRRPGEILELAEGRGRDGDPLLLAGLEVEQPELLVFVVMGEPASVRRGLTLPAEHLGVGGELLGLADAVRSEEHTSELQSRSD